MKGWIYANVSNRAKVALDNRAISCMDELADALRDHFSVERELKLESYQPVKKYQYESREGQFTCFKCGKPGHKAVDCPVGRSLRQQGRGSHEGYMDRKVTCYSCGEDGHKSPQYPAKNSNKPVDKSIKPKPVRNIRAEHATDVYLTGEVSGKEVPMLFDSSTSITIVPESLVTVDQLCDSSTTVKGFKSEPIVLPMANVPIKLGEMEWSERVAVVPVEEPEDERVLYALNLKSERGLKLVLLANDIEVNNVLAVQTRAMVR